MQLIVGFWFEVQLMEVIIKVFFVVSSMQRIKNSGGEMFHQYSALLKGFLVILVLSVWVDSGFPVREGNARNSSTNETIVLEYSYGLGYIPVEGEEESILPLFKTYSALPSWDWRSATYDSVTGDWTTIAKSQGGCGSCWDFAAHGVLEAIINIRRNNPDWDLDLSEQYILSCYSPGRGCGGSNAYWAYEYMYNNGGTIPETCFPYYADDDKPCSDKCASWQDLLVPISDYGYSSFPSRNAIKDMIYEHGPVCLAFWVYTDFYTGSPSFDENGIYQYDGVSEYRGGHQIVAIGYEDTPDNPDYDGYWICKNSWGATWGPWNDGCFGIAYGECDIEMELVYADYDRPDESFVRGDVAPPGAQDGLITMADGLMILGYYHGETHLDCMDAGDMNDDGVVTMGDGLQALGYYYGDPGTALEPPFPDCGADPTPDDGLYCFSHTCCMGGKAVAFKPSVSMEGAPNKLVLERAGVEDGIMRVPLDLVISEDVLGCAFLVDYDASKLSFVGLVGGEGYDFYRSYVVDEASGLVRVGCIPDLELKDVFVLGKHRVAEFEFRVNGSDACEFGLGEVEVVNTSFVTLPVEWVVKTGIANLPTEFALSQNYPNPFNPVTLIKYNLPVDCQVRLDVYNVVGQRVATLVDGYQKAGYKMVSWNAQDMASGVYFYRLTAGDIVSVKKMIFLR